MYVWYEYIKGTIWQQHDIFKHIFIVKIQYWILKVQSTFKFLFYGFRKRQWKGDKPMIFILHYRQTAICKLTLQWPYFQQNSMLTIQG